MSGSPLDQKLADLERRIEALEEQKSGKFNPLISSLTDEEVQKLPPRTQALRISMGTDLAHFIGKMSTEAIKTEIRALESHHDYVFQDTPGRDVTKVLEERKRWTTRYNALKAELDNR